MRHNVKITYASKTILEDNPLPGYVRTLRGVRDYIMNQFGMRCVLSTMKPGGDFLHGVLADDTSLDEFHTVKVLLQAKLWLPNFDKGDIEPFIVGPQTSSADEILSVYKNQFMWVKRSYDYTGGGTTHVGRPIEERIFEVYFDEVTALEKIRINLTQTIGMLEQKRAGVNNRIRKLAAEAAAVR